MPKGITRFTHDDAETWYQAEGRQIFLTDVVDEGNGESMSVGFARYGADQSNSWIVTYDEALVVTRGEYSVTSADGEKTTVGVGGVIFLEQGTEVTYSAGADGADVVYITYPHWMAAQKASEHAALLDDFHPVEAGAVRV
jgi:ethanolamine utilization protein EutQ